MRVTYVLRVHLVHALQRQQLLLGRQCLAAVGDHAQHLHRLPHARRRVAPLRLVAVGRIHAVLLEELFGHVGKVAARSVAFVESAAATRLDEKQLGLVRQGGAVVRCQHAQTVVDLERPVVHAEHLAVLAVRQDDDHGRVAPVVLGLEREATQRLVHLLHGDT